MNSPEPGGLRDMAHKMFYKILQVFFGKVFATRGNMGFFVPQKSSKSDKKFPLLNHQNQANMSSF